jgi:hypothetical protein
MRAGAAAYLRSDPPWQEFPNNNVIPVFSKSSSIHPMSLIQPAQQISDSYGTGETRHSLLVLLAVLLLAVAVRAPMLSLRFDRNPEAMGAFCAIQARNFVEMGVWRSGFVPVQSVGISPVSSDPPRLYPNHPPLAPLMVAASYACFGIGAWQTRLPPALFTLGCVAMVFLFLRRRAGLRAAALAAILFAVVPISVRYGGQPDVIGAQLVFFVLLAVAGYLRWQDQPNLKNFALMAIPFALAAATDWPAFFICPVLAGHFCLTRRPRRWMPMAFFAVFCTALLLVLYAHLSLAAHDWSLIPRNFLRRSVEDQSDNAGVFGWKRWFFSAAIGMNVKNHTAIVLLLALAWCAATLIQWIRTLHAGFGGTPTTRILPRTESKVRSAEKINPALHHLSTAAVTGLLLAWGILHVLVGRQGTFVHEWWWWPLTPGVTMAAALAIDGALRWYEIQRPAMIVPARGLTPLAVTTFAAVMVVRTVRPFYQPENIYGRMPAISGLYYTTAELGAAIRAAAPVNSAVVLAENDDEPSLWFYGDRPLIMNVWDPITLKERIQAGEMNLPFDFWQKWTPPPAVCIVPRQYETAAAPLLAFLREKQAQIQLPVPLDEKFWAFDLNTARTSKQ